MPIGSDPNDYVPVTLATDKGKSPAPTFRVRFLTDREMRRAIVLLRDAHRAAVEGEAAKDDAETDDADARLTQMLTDLFDLSLAGWEGVTFRGKPVVHGRDKPVDFLTTREKWELAEQCVYAPRITEADRRNFASPPGLDGAAPASAPAASAPTPPAPPTPSA